MFTTAVNYFLHQPKLPGTASQPHKKSISAGEVAAGQGERERRKTEEQRKRKSQGIEKKNKGKRYLYSHDVGMRNAGSGLADMAAGGHQE